MKIQELEVAVENKKQIGSNISVGITDGIGNSELKKIKEYNQKMIDTLIGCTFLNNHPDLTGKDIINLRAFARIFDMELKIVNKKDVILKRNGDVWKINKSFQYKPFLKSNIYYRYYDKKEHKTIIDGEKKVVEENTYKEIVVHKGEQLAFDNKIQKYYYHHSELGNCYFNTNVLVRNGNISTYALIATNIFTNKFVNVSHFISDMMVYDLLQSRMAILGNMEHFLEKEVQIYKYFNSVIRRLRIG